jgi:hypothetical protein
MWRRDSFFENQGANQGATKETSGFRGRRVRPRCAANSLFRNTLEDMPFVFNILGESSQVIAKYGS